MFNNSHVLIVQFQHDGLFIVKLLDDRYTVLDLVYINVIDVSAMLK